jgi:hypothetical protein
MRVLLAALRESALGPSRQRPRVGFLGRFGHGGGRDTGAWDTVLTSQNWPEAAGLGPAGIDRSRATAQQRFAMSSTLNPT